MYYHFKLYELRPKWGFTQNFEFILYLISLGLSNNRTL